MKKVREGYKMTEIGEIPKEWKVKKLGDVVEVISGATPKTNINEYWDNGDIYWATPTDITSNGKYIYKTEKSITESGLKNCSAKLLPIGSILMSSRATIGERCINNVPMATNQGFKSLVCKSEVNNEFIYYYVDILKERLIGLASGSTFLEVSKKVVEDIKIAIPNLKEQEKIALILSTVDEQIDNVDALIEKNKELKKGLMQTLLTKGIGHTKFKKTEIGEIPEEWEVRRLEDICDDITIGMVKTMTKFYVDNGVPLIRNSDIKENTIKTDSMVYLDKEFSRANQSKCLNIGQIVTVHTGDIGTSAVIEENMQGAQGFATLNTTVNKSIINEYYLCWYLNSDICKNQAYSFSTGDGRNNLNLKDFVNILAIVPSSIEEQKKIVFILNSISRKIQEYENKKQKLEELKKGLMQQLLSGRIRVI